MNLSAENTRVLKPATEKSYNARYVAGMCALLMVFIIGRALDTRLAYAFMAVSGVVFLFSKPRCCAIMLFFLLPFSYFLKIHPDDMSFFTVLFFLTVVKMVFTHGKISLGLFFLVAAFFAYHLTFFGMRELTTVLTMVAGCLMLYYMRQESIDIKTVVFAFAAGICLSSVLALLGETLPLVNTFVRNSMMRMGESEFQSRFSGFTGNPNYYTMAIVMAQAALLVLMHREKKQVAYIVGFLILSVFGFMSVSQSFLAAWILLVFCWFLISAQKGFSGVVRFMFIATLGLALMSYFAFDYIEAFIYRLFQWESNNLSAITTGRTDIWANYLKAIFADVKILFLGKGVNVLLDKKGAHNTYIESIYYFGVVGTGILFAMLKACLGKVFTARIMWIPVLTLLVRMLAISLIAYDDLWFYLAIIVLLAQYCAAPQTQPPEANVWR